MELITSERAAKWLQLCAKPPAPPLPDWLSRDNQIFIAMVYAMRFERRPFQHADWYMWPLYFALCEHTATTDGVLYPYRSALDAVFTRVRGTVTRGDPACDTKTCDALAALLTATEPQAPNAIAGAGHPLSALFWGLRDRLAAVVPTDPWRTATHNADAGVAFRALALQFCRFDKAEREPFTAFVASTSGSSSPKQEEGAAAATDSKSPPSNRQLQRVPFDDGRRQAKAARAPVRPAAAGLRGWEADLKWHVEAAGEAAGLAACPFRDAGCTFTYAKAHPERLQRHNIESLAQHIVLLKIPAEKMEALCEPLAAVLLGRAEACPVCEKRPPFKAAKRISAQLQLQPPEQQQQQRVAALVEHKLKPALSS